MRHLTADYLREVGTEIFRACGASPDEANVVASELVETSLMGIDSHGVIRIPQYVDEALAGLVRPGAASRVEKDTPTTAIVDCGWNFGIVSAYRLVDVAWGKAREHTTACVLGTNCHHVGRLGAYVQRLAERGMIAIATVNGSKLYHCVTPWGGREGRLATNPLAYGIPTSTQPIILDMSTSMVAEGKVRALLHQGEKVPSGCIQDAEGNPTTDPKDFYGPPMGTILPFGSQLGYKGFALSVLVEVLGRTLAGLSIAEEGKEYKLVNGLCLIAVNPDAFCGLETFKRLVDELSAYITSASPAPGYSKVRMPGSLDFETRAERLETGIPVPDKTWSLILEAAEKVGASIISL
jgi:uncharacterized oxidoreductase